MSNAVQTLNTKDLGSVSAYGDALTGGFSGTKEQFYAPFVNGGDTVLSIDPQNPQECELYITTQGIPIYTPPAWDTGTDEEIVTALRKHYAGKIDLTQYWHVGDTRSFNLAAISAFSGGYAQAAQTITLTIMNVGGRTLADNTTECAFVLGMTGYLATTEPRLGDWITSDARNWLNDNVRGAFDSSIVSIFKQYIVTTMTYVSSRWVFRTTLDYFTLPASYELFGSSVSDTYSQEGSKLAYYTNNESRQKGYSYWTRSLRQSDGYRVYVKADGSNIVGASPTSRYGYSLQCVI